MKTLVLYYSYTGHTKKLAEGLAAKESVDIAEIKAVKRPGVLKAFTAGCFAALGGRSWPIQPLDTNMAAYDRLILLIPVWAGNPPPAINALLEQLPEGKSIDIKMVSASGESKCRERLEAAIKSKGSTLKSFENVKAQKDGGSLTESRG